MKTSTIESFVKCMLTKEEGEFFKEYVDSMSGFFRMEEPIINYKKDFVLTEDHNNMIRDFHSQLICLMRLFHINDSNKKIYHDDSAIIATSYEIGEIIKDEGGFYTRLRIVTRYLYEENEEL